ncbi:MAG: methionine adenosyltransferase [Propionibacteriaceae bacterium]|jgi:S-adenosylmethionine synthetase|nr:methionine adenosyltransferase [Propionibacteriaceae bacterium]
MHTLFTSESVTEGHPDKMADAIADRILDALLAQDRLSRVAIETLLTTGAVVVAGEATTEGYADVAQIVRNTVLDIGYSSSKMGFDGNSCGVLVAIGNQSPDIAQGVDQAEEMRDGSVDFNDGQGAGDQGLMFGYACRETSALMPLPIHMAHRLSERLALVRKTGILDYLRPDGKTQVTVRYADGVPQSIDTVVVSTQHDPSVRQTQIYDDVVREVITPVADLFGLGLADATVFVNPTGSFVVGGPMGDAGVTGRKIIVDTYGGMARHGGGAFSGKDPSKVDRSAAYALRWVAKNVVAAGLADRCEVQVAYAIGRAHPVGLHVDCFGTAKVAPEQIRQAIMEVFDLRPRAIIDSLDLLRPIYSRVTNYGHFGRDLDVMTWERTNRAQALAAAVRG